MQSNLMTFEKIYTQNNNELFPFSKACAWDKLNQLGMPNFRNEEWKYTNLSSLLKQDFAKLPLNSELAKDNISNNIDSHNVFFEDNKNINFSSCWPKDLIFQEYCLLPENIKNKFDLNFELANEVEKTNRQFVLLNRSLCEKVICLYIPKSFKADKIVQMNFLKTAISDNVCSNLLFLVLLEEDSSLTILESHLDSDVEKYFSNINLKVLLKKNSKLEHYKFQKISDSAYFFTDNLITQEENSNYKSHRIFLGGKICRDEIHCNLIAKNAEVNLSAAYALRNKQHLDMHAVINHISPSCNSNTFYKGIVDDSARAVFNSKVIVNKDAQKTSSIQKNNNLILAEKAEVDTKPELQIYADDVKCSHGATVGELDQNQLFYLQTRGISEQQARILLLMAFLLEVIEQVENLEIKKILTQKLTTELNSAFIYEEK